jgi:hypothetical protein
MGDLVRSERSGSVEQLHQLFNDAIEIENNHKRLQLASPLTITLGDEFQGLATSLRAAAFICRDLRLALLRDGIDCRFAIGIVRLKTPLNQDRAWNMMGPGLAPTREKLNEKWAVSMYRFVLPDYPVIQMALDAIGAGLTSIERRWTPRQRADITDLIAGIAPAELARRRNVSVHSIYKVRSSGQFDAYAVQWEAIRSALAHVDDDLTTGR